MPMPKGMSMPMPKTASGMPQQKQPKTGQNQLPQGFPGQFNMPAMPGKMGQGQMPMMQGSMPMPTNQSFQPAGGMMPNPFPNSGMPFNPNQQPFVPSQMPMSKPKAEEAKPKGWADVMAQAEVEG